VQTGFAFYDEDERAAGLAPDLARFLDAGEPPIVFTLGSAAVMDPRGFFLESARSALALRRRAVLLVGSEPGAREGLPVDARIHIAEYAPFSQLFPRAAVNVHQGGIGTTGQALASGRPMLVMPCAHDQPDNGFRCERLGVALVIGRDQYEAARVAPLLERLVREPSFASRAAEVAREVRAEPGAEGAANLLAAVAAE
jgi:UDP:flavonoid glycosyltransferase YjiC (YdhE family)